METDNSVPYPLMTQNWNGYQGMELLFLFVEATCILNIQSGGQTSKNVLLAQKLFKSWDPPKFIIFKLYDSNR